MDQIVKIIRTNPTAIPAILQDSRTIVGQPWFYNAYNFLVTTGGKLLKHITIYDNVYVEANVHLCDASSAFRPTKEK